MTMEASKHNSTLICGHIHVARMAYKSGEYHAAYRNLNSSIYQLQEAHGHPIADEDYHELKHLMGKVQVALRLYEQAEWSFRDAIKFAEASKNLPKQLLISDTRHLADCVRLRGRYDEAEGLYKHCIEILKDNDTRKENQLPKAYLGLAQVYIDSHRYADAEAAIAQALLRFENHPGARSFWSGRALVTRARLLWAQNKVAESNETLQEALNILEPLIGPHHPIRNLALRRLGDVLRKEGQERSANAIASELKEVERYLKDHDS
ncbi:MAG: tetratricopeptide repeat protein [Cyanobacteria bacterium SZAS LIN-3]|nr:tetratricopeptide repeat protein [Cyanobacteria bacterium SZAS LIN-3]MBS2008008.1 tetratricopeptide repeat protein [Cyanobacteria bacterium SZAS TMP-1]